MNEQGLQNGSFQPGALLSMAELFTDRAFRIPNYQRSYSWERSNVLDLLQDIDNLIAKEGPDYIHYAGTIVAIPHQGGSEADAFTRPVPNGCQLLDIIDGQQRLTTLAVLASELSRRLASFDQSACNMIRARYLVDETSTLDIRRRFCVSEDADQYFFQCIVQRMPVSDLPENKAHINLQVARDEINGWLSKLPLPRLEKIVAVMERQIGFLLYTPRSHAEVGLMFEIINNRGKRLSELEKVKNYLIYFGTRNNAPSLIHAVNMAWPKIMANLAEAKALTNIEENSFLGHVWQVYRPRESKWDPYPGLKELGNAPYALLDFVDLLSTSAQTLALVETQKGMPVDLARSLLHISLQPSTAQVRPLIFAVFFREQDLARRTHLINLIEKLSFRFYGCNIAKLADSKQVELFDLAHVFYHHYNAELEGEQITMEWLLRKIVTFVKENAPDKSLVKELTLDEGEGGDYYNWRGLKYFLACYEEWLAGREQRTVEITKMLAPENSDYRADFYHREHLWAVKCPEPVKDQPQHRNKRRLGNFVLLEGPINISVSNKTLQHKIHNHFEMERHSLRPNTAMLDELPGLLKKAEEKLSEKWRRKVAGYWLDAYTGFFDMRETKMLTFALERWAVDYDGPRLQEFLVDSFANKNNSLPEDFLNGSSSAG